MDTLILYILVGVFSHYYATFMVAYEATEHGTFEAFMRAIFWRVYTGIVMVLLGFFLLGPSSTVVTLFVTCVFFTMCRIDYEDTFKFAQSLDKD